MNKFLFSSFFIVTVSVLFFSCSPKHSEIIVAEYTGQKITMGEFEKAYSKNAGTIEKNSTDPQTNYKNFLDLFVNFRMKLRDAEIRGFGQNEELQNELMDYKKKVGVTYGIEKTLVEPGIKKLYEQRKYELRVAHIMIRPDSTGKETAMLKAQNILDRIKNGENFDTLCAEYSDDNFSKTKGGDIYFITAGMIIPEFEEAAYNTSVGEVYPKVVETRYGFHIIKVTDKQNRVPQIRASHIMVDFYNEAGEVDSSNSRARIDSVAMLLKQGGNFEELAAQYSDDQGSKDKGGDLNYFQRRQMVQEFDEAVFNLKLGQISEPVRTNYGYHIIKVTDIKPYPTFEEDKEELKRLYKQTRYNQEYEEYINNIKSNFAFAINENFIDKIAARHDSVRIGKSYFESELKNELGDSAVYNLNKEPVSLTELIEKTQENYEFSNKLIDRPTLESAIKKTSGDIALDHDALTLDQKFPEFKELMEDYRNGIYIFKLQEEEVWSRINIDSVKLYEFWQKDPDKYKFADRVKFAEIFSRKDSLINHYYTLLENGAEFDTLAANYTERPGFKDKKGVFDLLDANSAEIAVEANKLRKPGDYSAPFKNSGGFSIVKLIMKDPARTKTFEEAKAEVSGAFQEFESKRLEEEYINNLKKLYKPVYHYDKLSEAFKEK